MGFGFIALLSKSSSAQPDSYSKLITQSYQTFHLPQPVFSVNTTELGKYSIPNISNSILSFKFQCFFIGNITHISGTVNQKHTFPAKLHFQTLFVCEQKYCLKMQKKFKLLNTIKTKSKFKYESECPKEIKFTAQSTCVIFGFATRNLNIHSYVKPLSNLRYLNIMVK